ncbi:unnamed protein product [Orchesella dallaii]|uniref:Uncharacterized protein n=1 Tax=Orchesella dallaii TaxID=48710 RepID=A0ABP1QVZ2_9HEXA
MSDNEDELGRVQTSSAISHSLTKSVRIPIILKVLVIAANVIVRHGVVSNEIVNESLDPDYSLRPVNLTCNETVLEGEKGDKVCSYPYSLQFFSFSAAICLPLLGAVAIIGLVMNALCSKPDAGNEGIRGGHYFCFWMVKPTN